MVQGPLTPMGGWTGVLVPKIPGQGSFFNLDQVVILTPHMYGLSTPLGEAMPMAFLISPFSFKFRKFNFFFLFFFQFLYYR